MLKEYQKVGSESTLRLTHASARGMLWVDPEPFESAFDRLTVLSHVEGLTAPSKIEGGNRGAALLTPLFRAGLERCRRVKSLNSTARHDMEQVKQADLIDRAIEVAVKAHQKQKRKGTRIAYITHPFAVGIILAGAGCSEEVVAAGIVHDTIEDARIKRSRIREEFGEQVAFIVEKCTEPDKRRSWRERKQHTLDSLKEAGLDVKFVACADKLHNIRTIARDYKRVGERVWKRFRRGREDQKWYYTSLVAALGSKGGNASYEKLYKELRRKVKEVFSEFEKKEDQA